jgi:glucose/arabinose dehydrogenase
MILILGALHFGGCTDGESSVTQPPPPPPPPLPGTPTLTRTVLVPGLSDVWDVALASDGTMFFTERCLGLSVRRANGVIVRLFGVAGSALVARDFFCYGQSGMNGVALDPAFATNRTIYVFMLSDLTTAPRRNRVVRLQLDAGYTMASARNDIVPDIAFKDVANDLGGPGSHSGGRIRFGPDGLLYITTGDNHSGTVPQSPTQLGGKVLRVTTTGAPAPGNNAPGGFDDRIYTYGHRNVQGISFRPGTGQPFVSEHGPNHSDEVTPLVAGGNGGWDPKDRAGIECPSDYCGYGGDPQTMPMTDLVRFPAALTPSWSNGEESEGTGPSTFLVGTQWRDWDGRLAVGVMAGRRISILELDVAGHATGVTTAALPAVRYRSLVIGPDGNLYIATDDGEIWRVVPGAPVSP